MITNLLFKVHEKAKEAKFDIHMIQKIDSNSASDVPWTVSNDEKKIQSALSTMNVIAGTSFMWSKEPYENSVDYLFIDEAGQLSLIDTLAVAHTCSNLVLLGDPQQLKQPQLMLMR